MTSSWNPPGVPGDVLGPRLGTIAIRHITPTLWRELGGVPPFTEFAVVRQTPTGPVLLGTDVDTVNVSRWAEMLALELGCRYVPPDATCEYCGRPTEGLTFCPPRGPFSVDGQPQLARDCEALYRSGEMYAWQPPSLLATAVAAGRRAA